VQIQKAVIHALENQRPTGCIIHPHPVQPAAFHPRPRPRKSGDLNAEKNKAIVLEAFDTLFNKRDYAAAERYWSPNYIQHSAHIEPGRDGLFNLIKAAPLSLKYEPGVILAENDYVIVHGRFSNVGLPVNWIAADIVRLKDGILVEHWDVIQDETTKELSKSGNRMFGKAFPLYG
jgi:predicted SnoaL-like aldol condensation-catalyzing enzyme